MSGWDIDISSIKVLERLEETDPYLYDSEAKSAAYRGDYAEALHHAKKALEYRKNGISHEALDGLYYHTLILEILLYMEKYNECLKYIEMNKLFERIEENHWNATNTKESREDIAYFYTIYIECWKKLRWKVNKNERVFICSDGTGMMPSLQAAIDKGCKKIICLGQTGPYEEDLCFEGEFFSGEVELTILPRKGLIKGKTYYGSLSKLKIHHGANVVIRDSKIGVFEESTAIEILDGNVRIKNSEIYSRAHYGIGVYVNGLSKLKMENCFISGPYAGIFAEGGNIELQTVRITDESNKIRRGIIACGEFNEVNMNIKNCYFSSVSPAIHVTDNAHVTVCDCDGGNSFTASNGGRLEVNKSKIGKVLAYSGSSIYLKDTEIDKIQVANAQIICEGRKKYYRRTLAIHKGNGADVKHDCKDAEESEHVSWYDEREVSGLASFPREFILGGKR